jgi:hypothetical protein
MHFHDTYEICKFTQVILRVISILAFPFNNRNCEDHCEQGSKPFNLPKNLIRHFFLCCKNTCKHFDIKRNCRYILTVSRWRKFVLHSDQGKNGDGFAHTPTSLPSLAHVSCDLYPGFNSACYRSELSN